LPTGEPLKNVNKEAYPSGYSRGRGTNSRGGYPKRNIQVDYIQDDKKQKTSISITDMIMGNSYSNIKSSLSSRIETGIE